MPSYKAQQFIDAIPGTGGVVTTIARIVGCDWHTAKKYIDGYATIKRAYEDECERVLDKAEHNVIAPILDGQDEEARLSKWYLTMKGGDRGYAPKQRQEISGAVTLTVVREDEPDGKAEEATP